MNRLCIVCMAYVYVHVTLMQGITKDFPSTVSEKTKKKIYVSFQYVTDCKNLT